VYWLLQLKDLRARPYQGSIGLSRNFNSEDGSLGVVVEVHNLSMKYHSYENGDAGYC
jgi:hypothetical protein